MQQLNDSERIFREQSACAKHDLIGTICNSEITHLLGLDNVDIKDMRAAWKQIEDYLHESVDKRVQGDTGYVTVEGHALWEKQPTKVSWMLL